MATLQLTVSHKRQIAVIAAGLILLSAASPVYAEGENPVTPVTTTMTTASTVNIHGIACVDQDMNGVCSFEEARVPNVVVRTVDGSSVTVTDNAGTYLLQAPARSAIEVSIPNGFKSINGNLRKLRIQMDDSSQLDIALTMENAFTTAQPVSATVGATSTGTTSTVAKALGITLSSDVIILAVLAIVLALIMMVLVLLLAGFRRMYQKSALQTRGGMREQTDIYPDASAANAPAWHMLAEQIVADALGETISIDETVGILEAKAEPNPRFSLVTRDGRTIIFTTDPRMLRKAKIIRRGDRVVDASARSSSNHVGAGNLWHQVLTIRNMWHITPPSRAHWYVVARGMGKKVSKVRGQAISEMPFLRFPQISRAGRES